MANPQLNQQQMENYGNIMSPNVGPTLASVAGVLALGLYYTQHISGALAITGFTPPFPDFVGTICIIPDGTFTTTTATNIGLASTAVVGKALFMTYDGSKWWPSY